MAFISRVLVLVAIALCLQTVAGFRRVGGWHGVDNEDMKNIKLIEKGNKMAARLPEWTEEWSAKPFEAVTTGATSMYSIEGCKESWLTVVEDILQIKSILTEYVSATANLSKESFNCLKSREKGIIKCLSTVVEEHLRHYKLLNETLRETLKHLGKALKQLAMCPFKLF